MERGRVEKTKEVYRKAWQQDLCYGGGFRGSFADELQIFLLRTGKA